MSYLKFDKNKLVNLEYSLSREVIRSNRAGSYISTTIAGCNTRKYHGLLICPVPGLGGDKHLLLSSLDETVIQHGAEFNLGIHKYGGDHYVPKGHKYIRDFEAELVPKTTWRVGGVVLTKERLLVENAPQALVRYTLVEAHSPTVLRFQPFLAFRSIHQLSKANTYIKEDYTSVANGVKLKLYDGYPFLHMQFSKEVEFISKSDWYNHIEYQKERERGFDYQEDLYVPGYFEVPIEKGEAIIFSASTFEVNTGALAAKFAEECEKRVPRNSFLNSLKNSAQQFIMHNGDETDIVAGFPFYNGITRQTFVSLPGLTLSLGDEETFEQVINSQLKWLHKGLFPKLFGDPSGGYGALDTPLWFFWAVQHLYTDREHGKGIWTQYGPAMKEILNSYRQGTDYGIHMYENGLIGSELMKNEALTWMDSMLNDQLVVKRNAMPVEVNALWYNAVCLALELASVSEDKEFFKEWEELPAVIAKSFVNEFWSDSVKYLADSIGVMNKDWSIRPNMVIAAAMDYSPLDREKREAILSVAKKRLLTPRGLRTLSPESSRYEGMISGSADQWEKAKHQGAVWPWLIQFFAESYLRVHKRGGLHVIKTILADFETDMTQHCIGSIAEMYDGNPPYAAKGAISQACSVAAVIRLFRMIADFDEE